MLMLAVIVFETDAAVGTTRFLGFIYTFVRLPLSLMSDPTINQVRTQADKDGNLLKKGGGLMDAWQSRRFDNLPLL